MTIPARKSCPTHFASRTIRCGGISPPGAASPLTSPTPADAAGKLNRCAAADRGVPDAHHGHVYELPTAFTHLVGCRLPLQLAPMGGGVGNPDLAVAVSAAGGLGMLSAAHPLPLADQ